MPQNIDIQNKTDEELVGLSLQDQLAFAVLIKRYEDKLQRYVKRISNFSYEDTEDILQEVFLKVYQNLNAFDSKLKFSSWVYRITHNQVISHYRKMKVRPKGVAIDPENNLLDNLASDLDIAQEYDRQLIKKRIKEVLSKLDLKYQQVLILKYLEEKDYQEISDILKKPKGTVATLLNRAKKKLQAEFKKQEIKY